MELIRFYRGVGIRRDALRTSLIELSIGTT